MNGRIIAICIGALFVVAALFAPVLSLPLAGNMSYMSLFGIEAAALGVAVAVLLYSALISRKESGLWASSAAIAAVAIWTATRLVLGLQMMRMRGRSDAMDDLAGAFQAVALESMTPQWGWALLAIGVIVVCGATALVHGESAESGPTDSNRSLLEFPATARVPVAVGIGFTVLLAIGQVAADLGSSAVQTRSADEKPDVWIDEPSIVGYETTFEQSGTLCVRNGTGKPIKLVRGVVHVRDLTGKPVDDIRVAVYDPIAPGALVRTPMHNIGNVPQGMTVTKSSSSQVFEITEVAYKESTEP